MGLVFPGFSVTGGSGEITNGTGEVDDLHLIVVIRALDFLVGEEAVGKDPGDEGDDEIVRPRGIAAKHGVRESREVGGSTRASRIFAAARHALIVLPAGEGATGPSALVGTESGIPVATHADKWQASAPRVFTTAFFPQSSVHSWTAS